MYNPKETIPALYIDVRKNKRECACVQCGMVIKKNDHMITLEHDRFKYCLLCGEKKLNGYKKHYKQKLAEIQKVFRATRFFKKEKVNLMLIGDEKPKKTL